MLKSMIIDAPSFSSLSRIEKLLQKLKIDQQASLTQLIPQITKAVPQMNISLSKNISSSDLKTWIALILNWINNVLPQALKFCYWTN